MNKKLIRLNESDLHRIVRESVSRIIKEENDDFSNVNVPYGKYKDEDYPMENLSSSDRKIYSWCLNVINEMRDRDMPLYDVLNEMPADGLTLAEAEQVCSVTDNYVSGARMMFVSGQGNEANDTTDYRIVRLLQQNHG